MGLMSDEPPTRRTGMSRVVVVIPSAFTLGNLFFGLWAIVSAYQHNFIWAGWFIVFAGILDMLDGRVARLSNTGTQFGAELDSLVDVISFGVAPALIMYFQEFHAGGRFAWVICYFYVVAVAVRLARYNVIAQQGSSTPGWFTGLPSPSAGMTLAVYYAFAQTAWYQEHWIPMLNTQHVVPILMIVLSVLMVSNVRYPKFPSGGFRSARQLAGTALWIMLLVGGLLAPEHFLFPLGLTYMVYGILRAFVLGITERGEGPDDGTPPDARIRPHTRRVARHSEHAT